MNQLATGGANTVTSPETQKVKKVVTAQEYRFSPQRGV